MTVRSVGKTAVYPHTAHIPGGGPAGHDCSTCLHYRRIARTRKRGRCRLWARFKGLVYRFDPDFQEKNRDWWVGLNAIPGYTAACKYWHSRDEEEETP